MAFGLVKAEKGVAHQLTAARIAQLHRWQMLGAAARRGKRTARHDIHRTRHAAYHGRHSIRSVAHAVAWGTTRLVLPTSLVTPVIPGYQPGDRIHTSLRGR